jgi:hypothetical protein
MNAAKTQAKGQWLSAKGCFQQKSHRLRWLKFKILFLRTRVAQALLPVCQGSVRLFMHVWHSRPRLWDLIGRGVSGLTFNACSCESKLKANG